MAIPLGPPPPSITIYHNKPFDYVCVIEASRVSSKTTITGHGTTWAAAVANALAMVEKPKCECCGREK